MRSACETTDRIGLSASSPEKEEMHKICSLQVERTEAEAIFYHLITFVQKGVCVCLKMATILFKSLTKSNNSTDFTESSQMPSRLLFIEAEKALDRVHWLYTHKVWFFWDYSLSHTVPIFHSLCMSLCLQPIIQTLPHY